MTLLAHGGKIAADVTKGGCSRLRAKGGRNLLLNFDHTKIPLRLIVRKWDGEIIEEGQHLVCPSQQIIQQVLRC